MPILREAAQLANQVYWQNTQKDLPTGWIVIDSSDNFSDYENLLAHKGYRGRAYINEHNREVVIAHRGTQLKEGMSIASANLVDDIRIPSAFIPLSIELALKFAEDIHKIYHPDYRIVEIGHSLGGVLAHLSGYVHKHPVIAFDPPGCLEQLYKLHMMQANPSLSLDEPQLKQQVTILSHDDIINQVNTQFGKIYQFNRSKKEDFSSSSLETHSLEYIIRHISEKTGDPTRTLVKNSLEELTLIEDDDREISILADYSIPQAIIDQARLRQDIKINEKQDLGTGSLFYTAKSLLSDFEFNDKKWCISHINAGSIWAGHSMLVVEGIKIERGIPQLFVGYYHLVIFKNDNTQQATVIKQEGNRHIYQHKYDLRQTKSWPCFAEKANIMAESIMHGAKIDYNLFGIHTIPYPNKKRAHNCTTWAVEQLKKVEINDSYLFDYLKGKPVVHASSHHFSEDPDALSPRESLSSSLHTGENPTDNEAEDDENNNIASSIESASPKGWKPYYQRFTTASSVVLGAMLLRLGYNYVNGSTEAPITEKGMDTPGIS